VESKWKNYHITTFLDSLSPKTEKLSLKEAMDLSRDRLILELEQSQYLTGWAEQNYEMAQ
jgi:hypothetical protein